MNCSLGFTPGWMLPVRGDPGGGSPGSPCWICAVRAMRRHRRVVLAGACALPVGVFDEDDRIRRTRSRRRSRIPGPATPMAMAIFVAAQAATPRLVALRSGFAPSLETSDCTCRPCATDTHCVGRRSWHRWRKIRTTAALAGHLRRRRFPTCPPWCPCRRKPTVGTRRGGRRLARLAAVGRRALRDRLARIILRPDGTTPKAGRIRRRTRRPAWSGSGAGGVSPADRAPVVRFTAATWLPHSGPAPRVIAVTFTTSATFGGHRGCGRCRAPAPLHVHRVPGRRRKAY